MQIAEVHRKAAEVHHKSAEVHNYSAEASQFYRGTLSWTEFGCLDVPFNITKD